MRVPGFIGPTYTPQSSVAACERTMNLIPEVIESPNGGKSKVVLIKAPGLRLFVLLPTGPVRAHFFQDGRFFAIGGGRFYEIFQDATYIDRGAVANDTRPGQIVSSGTAGNQMAVQSGGFLYAYDLVLNTITIVTDADLLLPVEQIAYADGYFISFQRGTATFQLSALFDCTTWDGLDVGMKQQTADNIRALLWIHKELWLIGSVTSEVWTNTGDPDFPFTPLSNVLIEHGTIAPSSVTKLNNMFFMLGNDPNGGRIVWTMGGSGGYAPARISNHAVENELNSYSSVEDAIGFGYQQKGHTFYILTIPLAGRTWAYDVNTEMWHELGYWNQIDGVFEAHLARCHGYCFEKHLVGSRLNGAIYEMTPDAYDDAGAEMRWLRRSMHTFSEMKRLFFPEFRLDMETGVGLASGQGSDPQIMMRYSNDQGKTWSNEILASAGKRGEYFVQVRFRRLGSARTSRVWEVSGSDAIPITLVDAYIPDVQVAAS